MAAAAAADPRLVILYRVSDNADVPKRLIRRSLPSPAKLTASELRNLLAADGVDLSRLLSLRCYDPRFDGWEELAQETELDLSSCRLIEGVVVLELLLALSAPPPPELVAAVLGHGTATPPRNVSQDSNLSTPALLHRESTTGTMLSHRDSVAGGSVVVGERMTSFGVSHPSNEALEAQGAPAAHRHSVIPGNRTGGITGGVPGMAPPLVSHRSSMHPELFDTLELGLLHAAPLVWRQGGMLAPLDHASVTLDFKGEVKALVDMLHRAQKGLSIRFDVATTEKVGGRPKP